MLILSALGRLLVVLCSFDLANKIAQVKYPNYTIQCECADLCSVKLRNDNGFYLFQKAEILDVVLFMDFYYLKILFYLKQTGLLKIYLVKIF